MKNSTLLRLIQLQCRTSFKINPYGRKGRGEGGQRNSKYEEWPCKEGGHVLPPFHFLLSNQFINLRLIETFLTLFVNWG